MNQSPEFQTLLQRVHRMTDLTKAGAVLGWDREVNMPSGGDAERVQQLTTIRRMIHELATDDDFGAELDAAEQQLSGSSPESLDAALLRRLRKDFERSRKLPESFVVEVSKTSAQAWQVWKKARAENDYSSFRPWLERLIGLQQQRAEYLGYDETPYDALLDAHEEGMLTREVAQLFDAVARCSRPLLEAIQERGRSVDDRCLHQDFAVEAQERFARYIAKAVGYDFQRGHLGTAVHPFATSFSRNDCRITTRWYPNFLSPSLFGTLHESGHAMYEQGTGESLARTPLARGCSSGFHESQSRMIENVVGRSMGFWRAHYGELQRCFPAQLGSVDLESFHAAINRVQPSLIRVEADELTYNMHIILRFELEQAMLSGDLNTEDLPAAWNDRLEALLGLRPDSDTEGVLQDVHWSGASFGYFPTYALGNLYAAQLFSAACEQDASIQTTLEEEGQVAPLLAWLRENVHRHGKRYTPAELVQRATGEPLSHEAFCRYVEDKFSAIYGL